MFKRFVTALVQKMIIFLSDNADYFKKSASEKEQALEDLSLPIAFKKYLLNIEEKEFLKDLKTILIFIHQPKDQSINKSEFFKSFLEFLTSDLARKMDFLDSNFYLLPASEREKTVNELIKGDSLLADSLKEILVNYNYQQIANTIKELAQNIADAPYILVQSPREVSKELKKEIREELVKNHPLTFPVFQVNKKIIGGMRIFENGTTKDYSWLSRVLRFTSLTTA